MKLFEQWAEYMSRRHDIWVRRHEGQPPPWTSDPILAQYRFCNIYRELDTVTQWIDTNIRKPFANHPHLWFMLAIARRINWPDTLAELIDDKKGAWPHMGNRNASAYNPDRLAQLLDDRTARGEQVYTGAYMITARTGPEHTGITKSRATAFDNLLPLWEKRADIEPLLTDYLEQAFNAILGQGFAWGPFMTYEVVSDLRHTRYLIDANDTMTWANAGPGALRGLNRLYGRPLKQPLKPAQALAEMRALLAETRKVWPRPSKLYPRLEMREIEHTLCEFDKYLRVKTGEGAPRSRYTPSPSATGARA